MFLVFSKKNIIKSILVLLIIILLSALLITNNSAQVYFGKVNKKIPIYNVKTEEKKVALTFDAAWGDDKTESIIKILKENNAGATFFLVGFWVDKYPEMVKKIHENNLEIGNHSKNHLNMPKLSYDKMLDELMYVNKKVNETVGVMPKFFRAPFGDYNTQLVELAEKNNIQPIQWDVDSLDWKGISGTEIYNRVIKKVKNGSIILFHNNSDHILDALPNIIMWLKNQGYQMVNLSNLVYKDNFTIDNNGTQIHV